MGLFGLMNLFPESLLCVESLTNNDLVPSLGKVLYAKGHQAQKPDSDFTTLPIVNHIQAESKTMPWCKTTVALCVDGMGQLKFYSLLAFGLYHKPSYHTD